MQIEKDPYYFRSEVSNSDLSWLQKILNPPKDDFDPTEAYAFGTLLDNMLTEPHKVNYYNFTCAGYQHTKQDFALAEDMKKSFYRDLLCKLLADNAEFQKISVDHKFPITWEGATVHLPVRAKWDLYAKPKLKMGGDIKSTTATTQKQFEAAAAHFFYFRQRSWYMNIEGMDRDLLVGISKVNQQVFKIPIQRGDKYHQLGTDQYSELAFNYWTLFHFQNQYEHAGVSAANAIQ